jgi:transposase
VAGLKRKQLILEKKEREYLLKVIKSGYFPATWVRRAKILLLFSEGKKIVEIARQLNITRSVINRCLDKAYAYGVVESLADLPRSGRDPSITEDAKSWVLSLICQSPKEFGYNTDKWTYRRLIEHIRNNCRYLGHDCLIKIDKGCLNMLLSKSTIKPYTKFYYLRQRDKVKKANLLCIYRQIHLIDETPAAISFGEKMGAQQKKILVPQLSPILGKYQTTAHDQQHKKVNTIYLQAGIDLLTGHLLPLVRNHHRIQEFIGFLKLLDQTYVKDWKIRIILDTHSSHTSMEARKYLLSLNKPNRFELVFYPKNGFWLNLIESFFSKLFRSLLRDIRVQSKTELIKLIYKRIHEVNQEPVFFKWDYKLDEISVSQ